ncbi:MAG: CoA activase [Dehalococcoidia bacterium]|nr:MAG: CoA activase [Dehalococcoidia bacterium]
MTSQSKTFMGIDIGSVSLNIAVIDKELQLLESIYERTRGQPISVLIDVFKGLEKDFPELCGAVCTGSGRKLIADVMGVDKENEIISQAKAVAYFHPEVRTIIEIGGQDSKLIFLERDEKSRRTVIVDHALNEICAAGTGSFLDQQAYRLGISIDEFSSLATRAEKPAAIAGRCSVFAKSDMVHLRQEGTSQEEIIAGLCYALARNYISNLGKGRRFVKPVAFQGGVAANKGVVKAFEELLELKPGELIIPEYFKVMGAFGAAITASEKQSDTPIRLQVATEALRHYLAKKANEAEIGHLRRLIYNGDGSTPLDECFISGKQQKNKVYIGVDVGAVSTNIVVLDENKKLLATKYLMTEGNPIESVKKGLKDIGHEIKDLIEVQAVATTGSARYFTADFISADFVINEITAQAKATLDIDETVDTIFEIGGQDSKYIRLKNGAVVDFEMNKVCAAGTGSFLQEQADRLDINIDEEFSKLAFSSKAPVDLGTRCTVFMESDLIHHQQVGSPKVDLLAGLSYSIANNYIEKVVGNKKIGERIYFQGGVAGNKSVLAAFENILGKKITVPQNYNVTGAIGAALIALERRHGYGKSNFVGFDLIDREYEVKSFECQHCPNHCDIKKVSIGGEFKSFYGGICDRYELKGEKRATRVLPDLFKEREEMLMSYYKEDEFAPNSPVIGIPRVLMFFEQFPLWAAFFEELGVKVVLSDKTNKRLIHRGLQEVLAEACYPVKIAYGHVANLIEKGVDRIFLPSIIDLEKESDDVTRSYNCPLIQGIPFMLRPAFKDKARIISPTIFMAKEKENLKVEMEKIGREFGKEKKKIGSAIAAALRAQDEFERIRRERGREILKTLKKDNEAVVVIGKPYNVHDLGLNLNIAKKLRHLGMLAIPFDLLPLDEVELPPHYSNLVWKNEQNLLRAAIMAKNNPGLNPIMITNYGCGPDAFFWKYLEETMEDDPYLLLEVDEHSGDAGMITRVEAFLDTLGRPKTQVTEERQEDLSVVRPSGGISIFKPSEKIRELNKTFYIPYVSGHSVIWAAALNSVGLNARVLPEPDELSKEIGRRYVSGKECHPYLLTTGDLVKMTELEDFDPDRAAFMMLNFDGSCRLSQYALSQKLVLKRLGLGHIPIVAPVISIRSDEGTELFGLKWAEAIWKGWLATDVLLKKLLHIRPYEINKGESDRVYAQAIEEIASGIIDGKFWQVLDRSIAAMDEIPTKNEDRPIIGIVGEFYTCMNPWSNNYIIQEFESLGAEVRLGPTTTDYVVYFNEVYPETHFSRGKYPAALYYYLRRFPFMHWKGKIEGMMKNELRDCRIPRVEDMVTLAAPYVSDDIDPVVTVNVAKAKNYAVQGCSGIANLVILNCLYGTVSTAIYRGIQREHNRIPVLNMIYDGLKQTNAKTRIEAFIHQAKLYRERYSMV